jgi:hypothetical protein
MAALVLVLVPGSWRLKQSGRSFASSWAVTEFRPSGRQAARLLLARLCCRPSWAARPTIGPAPGFRYLNPFLFQVNSDLIQISRIRIKLNSSAKIMKQVSLFF